MVRARINERSPVMSELGEQARRLAAAGFAVNALKSEQKVPATKHGHKDATWDQKQIRKWWAQNPDFNIGISCEASGIIVVDLDVKGDGPANWARLVEEHGLELDPVVVRTPSGGEHHYYRGQSVQSSAGRVAPGVDVRANGAYVVAPGSEVNGRTYYVEGRDSLPPTSELPEAPEGLKQLLNSRKTPPEAAPAHSGLPLGLVGQGVALARELVEVLETGEGSRNDQLNKSAFAVGQLAAGGALDAEVARGALEEAGRHIGLEPEEAQKSVESGMTAGADSPRELEPKPDSLYGPLDVAEWLKADHPDPARTGPGGLMYECGLHLLVGEPASGKSVVAYALMIDVMKDGHRALLLDEEAGPRDALGKMLALGATPELLGSKLIYLDPKGRDLERTRTYFHRLATQSDVKVVVVDSLGAALAIAGKSENDNSEVGSFLKHVILPLAKEHGIAVLVIDHKTKGDTGRYARGAGIKLQLADVQYNIIASQPFSREQSGWLTVECNKNRFGHFAEGTKWRADVMTGNGRIVLDVEEFTEADERDAVVNDRVVQGVARFYRDIYPQTFAKRNLHVELKQLGSKEKLETAATWLLNRGVLTRKNQSSPLQWVSDQTVLDFS